jgi:hypothetical protein
MPNDAAQVAESMVSHIARIRESVKDELVDRSSIGTLDLPEKLWEGLGKCLMRNRSTLGRQDWLPGQVGRSGILPVAIDEIRKV